MIMTSGEKLAKGYKTMKSKATKKAMKKIMKKAHPLRGLTPFLAPFRTDHFGGIIWDHNDMWSATILNWEDIMRDNFTKSP